MYQTAVGFVVWGTILVSSILILAVSFCTSDSASQDFLRVLRDMLPASWLSQALWEDNIVGILFFHTSHDFLWPDVDICIVLTSVRKTELLWSGSGKVLKKPWKLIGENMNICRAKRCLLSWLALWIFVRSMGVFHSTYKPDLLDLSADHASSKGGADLVFLLYLNIWIYAGEIKMATRLSPWDALLGNHSCV